MKRDWVRPGTMILAACLGLGLLAPASPQAQDLYDLETGREVALYGAGAALGLSTYLLSKNQTTLTPEILATMDAQQVNGFDRIACRQWSESAAKASDILQYSMTVAPLFLLTQTDQGMDSGTFGVMYTQTLLLNATTVGLIKSLVGRPRPFTYNDDPAIDPEYKLSGTAVRSFPSGHTANAFAMAVFSGEVYARLNPDDPARHWVWGGGLALATVTGYLRVRAGRHYPTDVLAGAVVGSFIGWLIPRLHEVEPGESGTPSTGPALSFAFQF